MCRKTLSLTLSLLAGLAAAPPPLALAQTSPRPSRPATVPPVTSATPTPDQQVTALEASCEASAAERAARHARTPLYERLGGDGGIQAITREIVRLHLQNPAIRHFFEKTDPDLVARHVAAFVISGTGGPKVYQGPDLTTSHRSMKLTNADFVSAGGDVVQAMKNLEHGQAEIDEVVCTLVALRSQVVLSRTAEPKR